MFLKKKGILQLLVLVFPFLLLAQNNDLLIGEGFAESDNLTEAVALAKKQAMADLASQIKARVWSEFENTVNETDSKVDEYTHSRIKVIADMEIEGVNYSVTKNPPAVYVKAVLNRKKAEENYRNRCQTLLQELQSRVQLVDQLLKQNKRGEALVELIKATRLYSSLEQNLMIYLALGGNDYNKFRPPFTHAQLDQRVFELSNQAVNTFSDAIKVLFVNLFKQLPAKSSLRIFPLEFENSGFCSPFSEYVQQEMVNILPQFVANPQQTNETLLLNGTYWIHQDGLVLLVQALDGSGNIRGSSRVKVPMAMVQALNVALKPQNFSNVKNDNPYFVEGKIVRGDLKIDVWTNKGNRDLLFKEGERLRIFVRVNQPAYVRCIYHLANGMRTPLVENFYIGKELVNKPVEISRDYEIVCAAPFGVERLQIFASTEKFPPLELRELELDGQMYQVLAQDLPQFLALTRGFIRKKKQNAKSAERVLTVTTIPAKMSTQ